MQLTTGGMIWPGSWIGSKLQDAIYLDMIQSSMYLTFDRYCETITLKFVNTILNLLIFKAKTVNIAVFNLKLENSSYLYNIAIYELQVKLKIDFIMAWGNYLINR
jgi:hypothetical protein